MLGLAGQLPHTVDPDEADASITVVRQDNVLHLAGRHAIPFNPESDIVFDGVSATPHHPNTLALTALQDNGYEVLSQRWCSIGGGFVVREDELDRASGEANAAVSYSFRSGQELLAFGAASGLFIANMVLANKVSRRPFAEVANYIDRVIAVMMACIDRGMVTEGSSSLTTAAFAPSKSSFRMARPRSTRCVK